MKLDKEKVEYIAKLARFNLSQEELKKFSEQLSNILNYVKQLEEVDTCNVSPTEKILGSDGNLREDVIERWDEEEVGSALEQAPLKEGIQTKVRRAL